MASGEVKRPTPTTGLRVNFLTNSTIGSWLPSGAQLDDLVGFRGRRIARPRTQLLETDPQRHGAAVADRRARDFQQLPHDADTIAHAAAVGIRALVPIRQQELVRQISHAGIDVDDVESRAARVCRACPWPAAAGYP